MTVHSLYIAYWSLRDPLCLSQSLPVVRALAGRGWRMGLMTFEQSQWAMSPEEELISRAELERVGIRWVPLWYHKRPAVASTLWDIVLGAWTAARLSRKWGVRLFHGRGSVAGAIASLASRATGGRFFNDADGPLSEEYVDAGIWRRGSLPYRMTRWAEGRALADADAVAVLSEHRRQEVASNARDEVTVLPCAVDTAHFVPDRGKGARLRQEIGLTGVILVYSGKAGGWYLTDAMLDFANVADRILGGVSLLVLTTGDAEAFVGPASRRGLRCYARRASHEEMSAYLSAGQVGLSFRLNTPSQKASSPIKNGEYLACGLPVVSTAGAGDYSDMIAERRVGVVVESLDDAGYRRAAERLRHILADPTLASRCREVARSEVGLSEVVVPRYLQIYERLLGSPLRGEE